MYDMFPSFSSVEPFTMAIYQPRTSHKPLALTKHEQMNNINIYSIHLTSISSRGNMQNDVDNKHMFPIQNMIYMQLMFYFPYILS